MKPLLLTLYLSTLTSNQETHMYNYQTQKPNLFTPEGVAMLNKIRENVRNKLATSGAVRLQEAIHHTLGSSWDMLACMDYLVETGFIREIPQRDVAAQHRVFVSAY